MNKKGIAAKLWLKFTNKEGYKHYKWSLANSMLMSRTAQFNSGLVINTIEKIKDHIAKGASLNIKHSGNAGDIIYALPTLKSIHEQTGAQINLFLHLNQPLELTPGTTHPLGNVMLNQKMADMLFPLLREQQYLAHCGAWGGERIDIDLDIFRQIALPLDRGNIARWCSYITGGSPKLYLPWLTVTPNTTYANEVVVARSERYQNHLVDHSFLRQYSNLTFIGVESEYKLMKKYVPAIKWVRVEDFLEMAGIIAGCKLFIGNQSFPFAVAEGLKVARILEASYHITNVMPEGENAHEFYFQEHFESLVKELNGNN